jgi:hypothetical protein
VRLSRTPSSVWIAREIEGRVDFDLRQVELAKFGWGPTHRDCPIEALRFAIETLRKGLRILSLWNLVKTAKDTVARDLGDSAHEELRFVS